MKSYTHFWKLLQYSPKLYIQCKAYVLLAYHIQCKVCAKTSPQFVFYIKMNVFALCSIPGRNKNTPVTHQDQDFQFTIHLKEMRPCLT